MLSPQTLFSFVEQCSRWCRQSADGTSRCSDSSASQYLWGIEDTGQRMLWTSAEPAGCGSAPATSGAPSAPNWRDHVVADSGHVELQRSGLSAVVRLLTTVVWRTLSCNSPVCLISKLKPECFIVCNMTWRLSCLRRRRWKKHVLVTRLACCFIVNSLSNSLERRGREHCQWVASSTISVLRPIAWQWLMQRARDSNQMSSILAALSSRWCDTHHDCKSQMVSASRWQPAVTGWDAYVDLFVVCKEMVADLESVEQDVNLFRISNKLYRAQNWSCCILVKIVDFMTFSIGIFRKHNL